MKPSRFNDEMNHEIVAALRAGWPYADILKQLDDNWPDSKPITLKNLQNHAARNLDAVKIRKERLRDELHRRAGAPAPNKRTPVTRRKRKEDQEPKPAATVLPPHWVPPATTFDNGNGDVMSAANEVFAQLANLDHDMRTRVLKASMALYGIES